MSTVFISYAREDSNIADNIAAVCDELDITSFKDDKDIHWGEDNHNAVRAALRTCAAVVVVVSPRSLESAWVPFELGHASALDKRILPFTTDKKVSLPEYIRHLNSVQDIADVRKYFQDTKPQLLEECQAAAVLHAPHAMAEASFPRCHDASLAFRARVEKLVEDGNAVKLKWLGLSMDYGTPLLNDLFRSILARNPKAKLSLQVCMVAPDWEPLKGYNEVWFRQSSTNLQTLQHLCNVTGDKYGDSDVTVEVYGYRHVPNWHGFVLNDRYLYVSECTWHNNQLVGGENSYELFDGERSERSAKKLENFLGWFAFCEQQLLASSVKSSGISA